MTETEYYAVIGRMVAEMRGLERRLNMLKEELVAAASLNDPAFCTFDGQEWLDRGQDHLGNMQADLETMEERVVKMKQILGDTIGEDDE